MPTIDTLTIENDVVPSNTDDYAVANSIEDGPHQYRLLNLPSLAKRIASAADHDALAEIHDRSLFHVGSHHPMQLVRFVDFLRRTSGDDASLRASRAYDLTVDKFSRLPKALSVEKGIDCRRYYSAYLAYVQSIREDLLGATALEREMLEARAFQTLVRRHFRLSLRECERSAFMTRYTWQLPNGALTLLMPRSIGGKARRQWLESNVPNVDPERPGERGRAQTIIDQKIGAQHTLTFDEARGIVNASSTMAPLPVPGEDLFCISLEGLAETVAAEKVDAIEDQRPAICAVGPTGLYTMIRQIFADLSCGSYHLSKVAATYGVSKATLSRFAGIRWAAKRDREMSAMPDLWRNTAKVLGSDPSFVEAAKAAGVWRRVEEVCTGTCTSEQEGGRNES